MSLQVYCDECKALIYSVAPGTEKLPAKWHYENYDFCSRRCLQRWVVANVLRLMRV